MSDELIKRRDLVASLDRIKNAETWLQVAEKLDLKITRPNSGTSHCTIRKPESASNDPRGVITTVYNGLFKQANIQIFKKLRKYGIAEDTIWVALGFLNANVESVVSIETENIVTEN